MDSPSLHSPDCRSKTRGVEATRKLATATPLGVKRSSGSSTRLPTSVIWVSPAMERLRFEIDGSGTVACSPDHPCRGRQNGMFRGGVWTTAARIEADGHGPRECFLEGFRSARRLRRPMRAAVQAISRKTMCEVQPGCASRAQRRSERQPGGREPEMIQKTRLVLGLVEPTADRLVVLAEGRRREIGLARPGIGPVVQTQYGAGQSDPALGRVGDVDEQAL